VPAGVVPKVRKLRAPQASTRRRPARVLTYKYDGDDGESRYYVDVTMGTLL